FGLSPCKTRAKRRRLIVRAQEIVSAIVHGLTELQTTLSHWAGAASSSRLGRIEPLAGKIGFVHFVGDASRKIPTPTGNKFLPAPVTHVIGRTLLGALLHSRTAGQNRRGDQ